MKNGVRPHFFCRSVDVRGGLLVAFVRASVGVPVTCGSEVRAVAIRSTGTDPLLPFAIPYDGYSKMAKRDGVCLDDSPAAL